MKRWFVLLLLVAFAVSSPVAEATNWGDILEGIGKIGGSGSTSRGTLRIAGKIVDRNLTPLEGITVAWSGDGGGHVSVKTNSEGNYVMNAPKHPEYKSATGTWTISGDRWRTIKESGRRYEGVYNYTMHHDYMTGKVTTTSGIPLQWVKLVFEQDGSASGRHEIYTDEYGNYEFTLPVSGAYYWVTVSLDGYQIQRHHRRLYDEEVWNLTLREG